MNKSHKPSLTNTAKSGVGCFLVATTLPVSSAPLAPDTIAEHLGSQGHHSKTVARASDTVRISITPTCVDSWCPTQEQRITRYIPSGASSEIVHRHDSAGATLSPRASPVGDGVDRDHIGDTSFLSNWQWYQKLTGQTNAEQPTQEEPPNLHSGNPVRVGNVKESIDQAVASATSRNWIEEARDIDIEKIDQKAQSILSRLTEFIKGLWNSHGEDTVNNVRESTPVIDEAINDIESRKK